MRWDKQEAEAKVAPAWTESQHSPNLAQPSSAEARVGAGGHCSWPRVPGAAGVGAPGERAQAHGVAREAPRTYRPAPPRPALAEEPGCVRGSPSAPPNTGPIPGDHQPRPGGPCPAQTSGFGVRAWPPPLSRSPTLWLQPRGQRGQPGSGTSILRPGPGPGAP